MTQHSKRTKRHAVLLGAAALATVLSLGPASVQALECAETNPTLAGDPLSGGLQLLGTHKLYRVQARPWAHIPTGARLTVRAPRGVTEADLHRALRCGASASSPIAVSGASYRVERRGDLYDVHVTASSRSAALEIQRRAESL